MKKGLLYFSVLLALSLGGWSCSDENKVFNAIENGEELQEGTSVPFLLGQNYPNPFNPSTNIQFRVADTLRLRLQVFTDDWEEVATVFERRFVAGYHTANFTIHEGLPSGEYYYTLTGRGITQIRKMKVVK